MTNMIFNSLLTKQFPIISYPNPTYCRAAQKPEPAKEQGFDKRSKGTAQGKAVAGNGNKRQNQTV